MEDKFVSVWAKTLNMAPEQIAEQCIESTFSAKMDIWRDNALEVPGFNSLFKAEPILPPAKMVRKKSEVGVPEQETPTDE